MKDFDQLVQDALKPFHASREQQDHYKTTYFDKNVVGETLYREWRFVKPKATSKIVATNIAKMVKSHFPTLTKEECDSLAYLSVCIDKLKRRVDTETEIGARYLLVYSKLVALLDHVFVNNIDSYAYYLHDESGKFLLSPHFLFEHIHALLCIVAHYTQTDNNAARYGLAADALREILLLSERVLEEEEEGGDSDETKMCYIVTPNSISNTTTTTTSHGIRERCILPKDFIRVILGGLGAIRARIHFCEARHNECLYRDSSETHYASLVHREYTLAHQESEKKSKFWHHTRFMAHFWLCRSHFLIASQESSSFLDSLIDGIETEEECEEARKTLARLLYVLDEVNQVEKTDTLTLLDTPLVREYNTLVNEISLLTKAIDTEIYDKRRMKEQVGLSFPLTPITSPVSSGLKDARRDAFQKYIEVHPLIEKSLALIRRVYESRRLGLQTITTIAYSDRQDAAVEEVCVDHLDNSARCAILGERARWLKWLLTQYSLHDSEFVLSSDLYAVFSDALCETEETQKEFV